MEKKELLLSEIREPPESLIDEVLDFVKFLKTKAALAGVNESETFKKDIEKLKMAFTIRDSHHKSLWEEEKHFTWWLSILLSAQIVIYNTLPGI